MRIHFIAIGGSVMHNMAIAMHEQGHEVSGSDDEIFEPALGRLASLGLLPGNTGWFPAKITADLDAVILGMHARADNPELIRAKELGIRIYSFPEYIYEQAKNKTRVVIGGSHGKTTITSMIMHVLRNCGYDFDYMVGAQIAGFDTMVRLTAKAPVIILEGDEYLTSTLDPRPKFHLYKPHIALLSGIAWDHINVFPTYEIYLSQFRAFIGLIESGGSLVYCADDPELVRMASEMRQGIEAVPYSLPDHRIESGITMVNLGGVETPLRVFGRHNLLNIAGALQVCRKLGVSESGFREAIAGFTGAARRLELLAAGKGVSVFKDFAHSPSKLKATLNAVREQFPDRELVACMELHTFSSLNRDFLSEYEGSMEQASEAVVFYSPHALEIKKMPPLSGDIIREAFQKTGLRVFTSADQLKQYLLGIKWENRNLLMMSSGSFDGLDLTALAGEIASG